ncbi:MAG: alpha/beta hydrolase [Sandaracinus sp.]
MPVRLFLASQLVRYQMRRRFERAGDVWPLRRMMETQRTKLKPPPSHVRVDPMVLDGVRGERVSVAGASHESAILYVHGGAFLAGSPENYRPLTWRLADRLKVPVYAVDYRLAPEHPFPAALEDVTTFYRALRARGYRRIAVAGDSAGGNLTLAAALDITAHGLPRPAALVAISPVTTLAEELPSVRTNERHDAMFPPVVTDSVVRRYAGDADPRHPRLSPLHAERAALAALPPTLLQCSEIEILRDHSVEMAARLREAGVTVELEVEPRVFHVWHLAADAVPEARRAIERVARFLTPHLR